MIESSDLLKEYPVIFYPSLAVKLGLGEAIIVQKLHFLLSLENSGKVIDGRRYIFNTIEQWRQMFPFWCEKTIRAAFKRLEGMHLVESCQPDGRMSRKKYYRLNDGMWVKMLKGSIPNPDSVKVTGSIRQELPHPKHGTGNIETGLKKSKETSQCDEPSFSAIWKPLKGTKAEQLSHIEPTFDFPSEREFDRFVEDEELDEIAMGKGGDLYSRLCDSKWHQWRGRKWVKIRDWEAYVRALNTKMAEATVNGGRF